MSVGRNDPCPCGSGKKYKKCCWARDQRERAAYVPAPEPPEEEPIAPLGAEDEADDLWDREPEADVPADDESEWDDEDLEDEQDSEEDTEDAATRAIRLAQNALWEDFDQRDYEGQISLFLEALGRSEVLDGELAFDLLESLRGEAIQRDDTERIEKLVDLLKERRPEVYRQKAPYLLSWRLELLVALQRFEELREPALEYAGFAANVIELFDRDLEAVVYHGQLDLAVEMFRAAWPGVRDSKKILDWAINEFAVNGLRYELLHYCQHTPSPQPDDPALIERLRAELPEYRPEFVRTFMEHVLGRVQEPVIPTGLPKPAGAGHRKLTGKVVEALRHWSGWCERMGMDFLGYWYREYGVPYSKADLASYHLTEYLSERLLGKLERQVHILYPGESRGAAGQKKGYHQVPLLCPDGKTLDQFLGRELGLLSWRYHRVAAVMEAIPAWLRFLEERQVIDAVQRASALSDLRTVYNDVAEGSKRNAEDPSLYQALTEAWRE